ncbi:hypothetical protein Anapl_04744 [Anas platyrhynchos]|uniref:Uncharacterized protein n=1 Tax=Anas platyrhynchos TaxID=8839 RepID=R0LVA7_ANAPL|nr:hypothetical protein Anapl_04744 [Anas platyrhynchos]
MRLQMLTEHERYLEQELKLINTKKFSLTSGQQPHPTALFTSPWDVTNITSGGRKAVNPLGSPRLVLLRGGTAAPYIPAPCAQYRSVLAADRARALKCRNRYAARAEASSGLSAPSATHAARHMPGERGTNHTELPTEGGSAATAKRVTRGTLDHARAVIHQSLRQGGVRAQQGVTGQSLHRRPSPGHQALPWGQGHQAIDEGTDKPYLVLSRCTVTKSPQSFHACLKLPEPISKWSLMIFKNQSYA